jgi:hypothetical protein
MPATRITLPADATLEVAGYARLFRTRLSAGEAGALTRELGPPPGPDWIALFTHLHRPGRPRRPTRWTLLTSDTAYAETLASTTGGRIDLPMNAIRDRFPLVAPG